VKQLFPDRLVWMMGMGRYPWADDPVSFKKLIYKCGLMKCACMRCFRTFYVGCAASGAVGKLLAEKRRRLS